MQVALGVLLGALTTMRAELAALLDATPGPNGVVVPAQAQTAPRPANAQPKPPTQAASAPAPKPKPQASKPQPKPAAAPKPAPKPAAPPVQAPVVAPEKDVINVVHYQRIVAAIPPEPRQRTDSWRKSFRRTFLEALEHDIAVATEMPLTQGLRQNLRSTLSVVERALQILETKRKRKTKNELRLEHIASSLRVMLGI